MTLPSIGDVVDDKFRIERKLGEGGTSTIYEVRHTITDKKFAIKWLSPQLVKNDLAIKLMVHEAKVCGRFVHPNAVQIYDICRTDESYYLLMEFLEGESLDARLHRVGRFSPQAAVDILLPCIEALSTAHRVGIVHRDVKPSNIFLQKIEGRAEEMPKLLDFGISNFLHNGIEISASTAGSGTPLYMAPEQMRAEPADPRFDIYAVGVVLYELVAGKPPFDSDDFDDLIHRVAESQADRLDDLVSVDPAFANVVARAMARGVEERFASMDAFAEALRPFGSQRVSAFVTPASTSWPPSRTQGQERAPSRPHTPRLWAQTSRGFMFRADHLSSPDSPPEAAAQLAAASAVQPASDPAPAGDSEQQLAVDVSVAESKPDAAEGVEAAAAKAAGAANEVTASIDIEIDVIEADAPAAQSQSLPPLAAKPAPDVTAAERAARARAAAAEAEQAAKKSVGPRLEVVPPPAGAHAAKPKSLAELASLIPQPSHRSHPRTAMLQPPNGEPRSRAITIRPPPGDVLQATIVPRGVLPQPRAAIKRRTGELGWVDDGGSTWQPSVEGFAKGLPKALKKRHAGYAAAFAGALLITLYTLAKGPEPSERATETTHSAAKSKQGAAGPSVESAKAVTPPAKPEAAERAAKPAIEPVAAEALPKNTAPQLAAPEPAVPQQQAAKPAAEERPEVKHERPPIAAAIKPADPKPDAVEVARATRSSERKKAERQKERRLAREIANVTRRPLQAEPAAPVAKRVASPEAARAEHPGAGDAVRKGLSLPAAYVSRQDF